MKGRQKYKSMGREIGSSKKMNEIDKPSAKLTERERRAQIKNERGREYVIVDTTESTIIRAHLESFYPNKSENCKK